jgi:hypothetical protein
MEKSVRVSEREYSKKMADLNRGFEVSLPICMFLSSIPITIPSDSRKLIFWMNDVYQYSNSNWCVFSMSPSRNTQPIPNPRWTAGDCAHRTAKGAGSLWYHWFLQSIRSGGHCTTRCIKEGRPARQTSSTSSSETTEQLRRRPSSRPLIKYVPHSLICPVFAHAGNQSESALRNIARNLRRKCWFCFDKCHCRMLFVIFCFGLVSCQYITDWLTRSTVLKHFSSSMEVLRV